MGNPNSEKIPNLPGQRPISSIITLKNETKEAIGTRLEYSSAAVRNLIEKSRYIQDRSSSNALVTNFEKRPQNNGSSEVEIISYVNNPQEINKADTDVRTIRPISPYDQPGSNKSVLITLLNGFKGKPEYTALLNALRTYINEEKALKGAVA